MIRSNLRALGFVNKALAVFFGGLIISQALLWFMLTRLATVSLGYGVFCAIGLYLFTRWDHGKLLSSMRAGGAVGKSFGSAFLVWLLGAFASAVLFFIVGWINLVS